MKRRGGKREGAGRKKSPALTKREKSIKNTGEQISIIYIWKIAFSLPGESFVRGGNLRTRFELRVIISCLVWSSDEDKLRYTVDYLLDKENLYYIRTLFSTGRASVLVVTWAWFLNLDTGEVVETKL